jgi:protein RecA
MRKTQPSYPSITRRNMATKDLLERLSKNKDLPDVFAGTDIRLKSHIPYGIPTGIPQLDLSLGRPGYPAGRNIELYGFEMSGKTTAALAAAASAQRLGNTVVWIDTEKTWDPAWAEKCGVDPDNLIVADADSLEEIWKTVEMATEAIEDDERLLIVVDSATAVMSESQWEKEVGEEQRIGQDARVMRQALRKLNNRLATKNVTCIFINHAITKMVSFGKTSDSGGGHALKFWSSIRIEFAKVGEVTTGKGKEQIRRGQKVKLSPIKNKVMQTGRKNVDIELIETGFDLSNGLLEGLLEIKAVERLNNINYFFKPTETQLTRAEWPAFVEKQGGVGKMYQYFLRAARDNGFITSYGDTTEQTNASEAETEQASMEDHTTTGD